MPRRLGASRIGCALSTFRVGSEQVALRVDPRQPDILIGEAEGSGLLLHQRNDLVPCHKAACSLGVVTVPLALVLCVPGNPFNLLTEVA